MTNLSDRDVSRLLDRALVEWCSPTLVGLKPAGMFTLGRVMQVGVRNDGMPLMAGISAAQADDAVRRAAGRLAPAGVRMRALAHRRGGSLVFAWRPEVLAAFVGRDPEATMLEVEGYDVADVESCVDRLQARVLSFDARPRNPDGTDRFPHEVGFLLGYPLDDVIGFVRTRGKAKARGWWNVYSDVSLARRVFGAYDSCVGACSQALAQGASPASIAAGSRDMPLCRPAEALALFAGGRG